MSGGLLWYVARAGGLVAWALAASAVIWGLALSTRVLGRRPRPAWLFDLHRFLGGLALVFTGVHVVAVLGDSYVSFSLVNVLVPLTGSWHPVAVAWGIVGFYLLLAVELTSLARRHVPLRIWRRVHYGSFILFASTTVHALTAGTDRHAAAFLVAVVAVCGLVALLTVVRLAMARAAPPAPAPARARAASGAPRGRGQLVGELAKEQADVGDHAGRLRRAPVG
ncbi:MAG TPA: ferric reductase-like transmembrane domain-containing protein [Actinomycetota bacterium]